MQHEFPGPCPICTGREFEQHLTVTDHSVTRETFSIVRCKSCGFLITTPMPPREEIGRYYQSEDYISHTGGSDRIIDRLYRRIRTHTLQTKINLISKYQATHHLLDYGCGTGNFLAACKSAGWEVEGVEPSPSARSRAPREIKVHASLNEVTTKANVITLWHVLEHVHDLNDTIAKLRSILTNNGTIFIAVPNHESYDAAYYKETWAGYDVPRHLWHFKKENIRALLTRHNLKLTAIHPMKFDAFYVSLLSEQYRRKTRSLLSTGPSAIVRGMLSNLRAGKDNYSSLIYIAEP